MQAFQQRHYCADSCAVSISGGFEVKHVQELLEASPFAQLPRSSGAAPDRPALQVRPGLHSLELPRLESARLLMLWAAPPAAEMTALSSTDLLTTVLAEGRSSRLVRCLREEKQWVESIDVDVHALEQGSLVILEAICPSERVGEVHQEVSTILRQLQHLHRRPLNSSGPNGCWIMGTVLPWRGLALCSTPGSSHIDEPARTPRRTAFALASVPARDPAAGGLGLRSRAGLHPASHTAMTASLHWLEPGFGDVVAARWCCRSGALPIHLDKLDCINCWLAH